MRTHSTASKFGPQDTEKPGEAKEELPAPAKPVTQAPILASNAFFRVAAKELPSSFLPLKNTTFQLFG